MKRKDVLIAVIGGCIGALVTMAWGCLRLSGWLLNLSPQMPGHYARVTEAERGAVTRYRYKKGR